RERQRIARELHDILSHSVSAMMMQAAGARAVAARLSQERPEDQRLDTVHDSLTTIEKTGSQSMRELHRLLGILRDREGEDTEGSVLNIDVSDGLPGEPVILNLLDLVSLSRQSGLTVELHDSGAQRVLDPSVKTAAYRVVQESLTNALKHAGRGAVVDIFQVWQDDRLQLQVRSRAGHDGTRPGTPSGGTGLFGLRERVELVGGHFESGWAGEEFVTTARLPLTGGSTLELGARR
ncbi:MAG: histidine kinase, partial [Ornithinimicrobium sp.]|uniref:sensor histidine kinase n=1 Tax=Ornithinimicrobium sp. TaxID=1977084 RepID=UPI0026DF60E7